ncbi:DMT family transporter [Frigidibacter sp. RF13]|uniref:DMT family transporter n=1 Tax=Frigidibacter sp. RF13 TaxID=2997340 RepID=UPI002270118C|nr:DMT family transporter [Frigidibacter sp. RF13]MCY1126823.1 DMT family transporter [Frigidibacter sp. RF13]
MPIRYWLLILTLGILWGGSFLMNAVLLRELGPLTVSLGRVGVGAMGCWVWVWISGRALRLSPRTVGGLFLLGIVFFAIPFALYPVAQRHLPSGVAGIVNAMTPVLVVIVSHLWPGGERATAARAAGVATGFAGIALLSWPYLSAGQMPALWAILTALLAPVCYGIATNLARRFRTLDPALLAAWSLSGAALFIMPFALLAEGLPRIERPETWGALLIVGLLLTSVGFTLFYWLLARAGATATSTVTFVAPVSAVALGAHVLGEPVLWEHLAGMAVIFAGLLMIDGRLFGWLGLGRALAGAAKDQPDS